ncbi:MAG TPA: SDR family oxidoreductase [Candidatus Paceibacterota bacterium]|nr:SDR family oxidoreductase [Candidatus Paceibacterota bacterium]
MDLKNKVVVITGASRGLGKSLARILFNEKAKVIISARSKKELVAACKETGAISFAGDVTKENDLKKLANFAIKKYGRIDIWINNAGIVLPHQEIEKINPKLAHHVFEVNFFGTFYGSREAMKIMKKQKRGTIINIGSISSLVGRPLSSIYASSKWAVRGFTESLRLALEPENISVIAVHPSGFQTTIFGKFKPVGYDDWMKTEYVADRIVRNLKLKKPKTEITINKK